MTGHVFDTEEEAMAYALAPYRRADEPPVIELIEHKHVDITGRTISEFTGSPSVWMRQFQSPAHLQVKIINKTVVR